MAALKDIVYESPCLVRRKAGATVTAGELVYLDASANWDVSKTANASCSGKAFDGVTMDSNTEGNWISVAVEPSEVYVNATGTLTAGDYVVPGADGHALKWATSAGEDIIICGRVIKGAATGNPALIKLMNVLNVSST